MRRILVATALTLILIGCNKRSASTGKKKMPADKNTFLIELSASPNAQFGKVAFEKQTEANRVFSCIWALESDVNNGGFRQYYLNSSGDTAHKAEWALRQIKAHKMADIVKKANSVFPGAVPPRDRDKRKKLIKKFDDSVAALWEKLNNDFFAYPDDMTELLYSYVMQHKEDFGIK